MYLKTAVFSVLLFAMQHIVRVIYSLGYHLHYYQHYPGPCKQYQEIEFGSGNFYTLPDGTTFITSGLDMNAFSRTFQLRYTKRGIEGAIYMTNLSQSDSQLEKLDIVTVSGNPFDISTFHPQGISVWPVLDDGLYTMFVVNHPTRTADVVEKFLFDPRNLTLYHTESYTDTKLRSVHDVQATGFDAFYVTNILHESQSRLFMLIELFALMPWSTVVFFSRDTGYSVVASGLMSATGIVMSNCGMFVYVMLSLGSQVLVYKRGEDNSLTLQQIFKLYTHPDNAVVDPLTGDIFVGAHPIAHQYLSHIDNPVRHKAASQVLHLRLSEGNISSVTELFYDDGTLISGSSTAVVYRNTLLIGSSIDKLVSCLVNVPI